MTQPTSRLDPHGGRNWMHTLGYGPLDEDAAAEPERELCQACGGRGQFEWVTGPWRSTVTCEVCRGYGVMVEGVPG